MEFNFVQLPFNHEAKGTVEACGLTEEQVLKLEAEDGGIEFVGCTSQVVEKVESDLLANPVKMRAFITLYVVKQIKAQTTPQTPEEFIMMLMGQGR